MKERLEILRMVQEARRGSRQPLVLEMCDIIEELLRHPVAKLAQVVRDPLEKSEVVRGARKRGRPLLGVVKLSGSERVRRWREKRRVK